MPPMTEEMMCARPMTGIYLDISFKLCTAAGNEIDHLAFCVLDHNLQPVMHKGCSGFPEWDQLAYRLAWTAGSISGDTRDLNRFTYPPRKDGEETPAYKLFTVRADPYISARHEVRGDPLFCDEAGGAAIYYDMTTPGVAGAIGVVLDGEGCHKLIARVRGDIIEGEVPTPPPYVRDSTSPLVPTLPERKLLTV